MGEVAAVHAHGAQKECTRSWAGRGMVRARALTGHAGSLRRAGPLAAMTSVEELDEGIRWWEPGNVLGGGAVSSRVVTQGGTGIMVFCLVQAEFNPARRRLSRRRKTYSRGLVAPSASGLLRAIRYALLPLDRYHTAVVRAAVVCM